MPSGGRDTEPWAPFPVQDWSALPAPEPGAEAAVSPDWAPPRVPRPWWVPLIVLLVVAALVGGAVYVADHADGTSSDTEATRFVPTDGAVANQRREEGRGTQTTTSKVVTESARLTGNAALLSLDFAFGVEAAGSLDLDQLPRTPFWRTTTTETGSITSSHQLVRLYRTAGPIELVAESGPGRAHVYRPALVELPADAAPGSRWSAEGTASDTLSYRSALQAESAAGGCLLVTGTIAYTATRGGQAAQTSTVSKTWCPGLGVTEDRETTGDQTLAETRMDGAAADPALRTVTEPWVWTDPARWTSKSFGAMSIDPNFGEGIMAGSPSEIAPVVTASGLVIRSTSSDDLVAFTPKTPDRWTSLWRMRPGGTVLSVAAFGDVVVTTTSHRRVVGYTDAGVRLWSVDLAELAFHPPVRVSESEVALVDAGGDVRLIELTSGMVRWQHNVGAEVTAAPVGDPRAIVVLDGSGLLTAWHPRSGEQLWSKELDGQRAAVVGDLVVVHNDATLEALEITTGTHRWLQSIRGTLDDLRAFGDRLVLATQLGTTIFDVYGRVLSRHPPYEITTVNGDYLIGWGVRRADVIDSTLTQLTSFTVPERTLASAGRKPLAYRQGVWLFSGTWEFTAWSDEP